MARCWLLASDRAARESPHKAADYQLLATSVSALRSLRAGDWSPEVALNNHRWWRLAAPGAAATGALCAEPGVALLHSRAHILSFLLLFLILNS